MKTTSPTPSAPPEYVGPVAAQTETLEGWGMHNRSRSQVVRPRDVRQLAEIFAAVSATGGTIGLRGAGCSYGDAALNTDHVVLDTRALNRILAWDADTGLVTVEPGVTIAQLWQRILPDGWWPAVVPGTSVITIGGGAAMNVHGKNNWHLGSFGDWVRSFDLLLPSGETLTCTPHHHADLFYSAIGGLGLLGCFTSITLQARRIYSGLVSETQTAHDSLAALLDALEAATAHATDLVAWLDTSARGQHLGRGLLKAGRDLAPEEDPHPERTLTAASQLPRGGIASLLPADLIPRLARPMTSRLGVRLANQMQWRRGQSAAAAHPHLTSYARANFLLDAIPNWREAYRPGGLIQHQSFVPRETAASVFRMLLERSHAAGIVPALAVLKKHRPDDFLLSYLGDGYSLALDYPVRRGEETRILALMATLNEILADNGGQCYFAKDSTVTAAQARRMFTQANLARFLVLKHEYDRGGLLSTDLYRRALAPEAGRSPHPSPRDDLS